jgi:hypothetical protein
MQNSNLDQTLPVASGSPRRRRRTVVLSVGALALVLATTGIVAVALAGGSVSSAQMKDRSVSLGRPAPIEPASRPPSGHAPSNSNGNSSSSTSLGTGPVLADGTYPTYIRGVDVDGAKITVDVVQVFEDEAAVKAALEDGKSPDQARYLYIYVRNQNPLLRTLTVAGDLHIQFMGTCEEPPSLRSALTELAKKTTPFSTTYYYDVTVRDGLIHTITQHLAIPAC